jgi:plasmid rolling circle replication initiator protein Rep
MLKLDYATNSPAAQDPSLESPTPQFLTDYSPKDKPWDVHRAQAQAVEGVYKDTIYDCLAGRIRCCSGYLGFSWENNPDTGENRLRLRVARFCRVRLCPVCQWRRSLMWQARFLKALPDIEKAYPSARWVFLTLTIRNMPLPELRTSLQEMNKAWNRLRLRPEFSENVQGWSRTIEVTRAENDYAHPHFHYLLMVRPGYFSGKNYVTQRRWTELWRECALLDYNPIVYIRSVKKKPGAISGEMPLRRAISETFKYAVKPSDMFGDWLIELTTQVFRLRFIACGGALKNVLRESEETEKDLLLADENSGNEEDKPKLFFDWHRQIRRYKKR